MSSRYGVALSEHPVPSHAVGEVIGEVLDKVGVEPELAVIFVSGSLTGAIEDIIATVNELLRPRHLLGVTAVGVIGGRREVEDTPAISLWAATDVAIQPVRLTARQSPLGPEIHGLSRIERDDDRTLVLLTDPYSFPVEDLIEELGRRAPLVRVVGGMASAARAPGGNRLIVDSTVHDDGAIGFLVDSNRVTTVVSQGCRPIGEPFIVTSAAGSLIHELGGQRALSRLQELIESASKSDRALLAKGLHVGLVVDERKADFESGDFYIRNVLGADKTSGAVAISEDVAVGTTVQFQVRDAVTADEELLDLLADKRADAALLFSCNGRGNHMFGVSDHDVSVIDDTTESKATAGMFCAGEIGPIGHRNLLHAFTASMVLFD